MNAKWQDINRQKGDGVDIEINRVTTCPGRSGANTAAFSFLWHAAICVVTMSAVCDAAEFVGKDNSNASAKIASQSVISVLFDDMLIADNAAFVRGRAKALPPDKRYDYLLAWVLTSETHETIRLSATLTTGDPVVPLTDDHPFDVRRLRIGSKLGQRRIHSGGNLVSSAFDLVRTAKELGRLSELQLAIDGCRVREELQERCRLLLQSIAAMADGDENTAGVAADELFRTRTSLMNHWKSETSISATEPGQRTVMMRL